MAEYDGLSPGQVLADASVAEFIKALGLSVAEAQKALDINSVEQLDAFIQPVPGLGGKTLLDMGLMPAFYHFQHADITCSMNLSLRVEKEIGVDFGIEGNFSDTSTTGDSSESSSSSTTSGSTSRTSTREARVSVEARAQGALTVNGQSNSLSGLDPAARIRALASTLQGNETADAVLVRENRSEIATSTDADPELVRCQPNSVLFVGGGFHRGVIRVDTAPGAPVEYQLRTTNRATGPAGTIMEHVNGLKAAIDAKDGYRATHFGPTQPLAACFFDHDVATVADRTAEGQPNDTYLANIANFLRDTGTVVTLEGRTDHSGGDTYNNRLSLNRAENVRQELIDRGVNASQLGTPTGTGESAWAGPDDNSRDPNKRVVLVIMPAGAEYLYVAASDGKQIGATVTPNKHDPYDPSGNGWVSLFRPTNDLTADLAGKKVTVKSTDFPLRPAGGDGLTAGSPEAFAANLAADVNGNEPLDVQASRIGSRVNLMNDTDKYELTLLTTRSTQIELSGSDSVTVTTQFTRTTSNRQTTERTGNRTVAVGASLDVRYGRQFEMNVTGNSAISARLVSVPAPPEFLATMKEFLTDSGDG